MTRIFLRHMLSTLAAFALVFAFMSSPVSAQSSKFKKGQQSQPSKSKVFPHPVRGEALSGSNQEAKTPKGLATTPRPPKNKNIDLKASSLYGLAN